MFYRLCKPLNILFSSTNDADMTIVIKQVYVLLVGKSVYMVNVNCYILSRLETSFVSCISY